MEKYIQIGVTALRSPTGEFLESVPLYIKESDAGEINKKTGRTVAEDLALDDVAKVFADKFKQYAQETKKKTKTQSKRPPKNKRASVKENEN